MLVTSILSISHNVFYPINDEIRAIFDLGLACQAKGHSNRIPTFQTLPRIYGNGPYGNNRKTRKSANHSLQIISMRLKKGPWKQVYIFSVEHDS